WARSDIWWEHSLSDVERWREGASALFFALHESAHGIDGYAMYRIKPEWKDGLPANQVRVREQIAETPEAYEDLWRFLFGIDLTKQVEAWPRPVDEPLLWMLAEPRRLDFKIHDGLWIRLIDLPGALAARHSSVEASLVFDVRDLF